MQDIFLFPSHRDRCPTRALLRISLDVWEAIHRSAWGRRRNSDWFSSQTEMQRHKSYFHRHLPKQQGAGELICKFTITDKEISTERKCGLQFPLAYCTNWRSTAGRRDSLNNVIPASRIQSLTNDKKRRKEGEQWGIEKEVEKYEVCALTYEDELEGDRCWIKCYDCVHRCHLHCLSCRWLENPDLEDQNVSNIRRLYYQARRNEILSGGLIERFFKRYKKFTIFVFVALQKSGGWGGGGGRAPPPPSKNRGEKK